MYNSLLMGSNETRACHQACEKDIVEEEYGPRGDDIRRYDVDIFTVESRIGSGNLTI